MTRAAVEHIQSCNTHYVIFVVKREEKRLFGDILTDENNIKVDVKEIEL